MKVLFKRDVQDVGKAGQVRDVSDGYARNYLLPRGLAIPATDSTLKQVAHAEALAARKAATEEQSARDLKARLEASPVTLRAKAGTQGRLYGSITTADVASAVNQQFHVELERRDLEIPETIRTVGTYPVRARLHRSVTASLQVQVQAEA